MKLLIISLNWVEYVVELANALAERDHHVEMVLKSECVGKTVGSALPVLLNPGIKCHLIDDRPRGPRDPRQLATIAHLMQLIRRSSPDIINPHEATNTY